MTVKVGIVGCGRMASAHAGALNRIGESEIVGVYDIDMPKAEAFAKQFGAAKVCSGREELLTQCGVQLLLICDYGHQHADELHAAMNAGIRSIFCEKPVIRHEEEAASLLKQQQETGTLIAVGHIRRVFPDQLKMKEILDSGILGRIHFCKIHSCVASFARTRGDYFAEYEQSGGCALDMGTHFADMLNWFFGRPVAAGGTVFGMSEKIIGGELPSDYSIGYIRYPGDIVCGMDVSYQRHGVSGTTMEIYGEKAAMYCIDGKVSVVSNDFRTEYNIPEKDLHAEQMKLMLKMTTERAEPPCTLKDGIIAAFAMLKIMNPEISDENFLKGI